VKDIAGKTVVVTGASSGIGREIAVAFGRHGARVVVHYRSDAAGAHEVADLVNDGGGTAQIFGADLSVAAECQAFADEVLDAVERVDVVVNSVGGFVRRVPLADADDCRSGCSSSGLAATTRRTWVESRCACGSTTSGEA